MRRAAARSGEQWALDTDESAELRAEMVRTRPTLGGVPGACNVFCTLTRADGSVHPLPNIHNALTDAGRTYLRDLIVDGPNTSNRVGLGGGNDVQIRLVDQAGAGLGRWAARDSSALSGASGTVEKQLTGITGTAAGAQIRIGSTVIAEGEFPGVLLASGDTFDVIWEFQLNPAPGAVLQTVTDYGIVYAYNPPADPQVESNRYQLWDDGPDQLKLREYLMQLLWGPKTGQEGLGATNASLRLQLYYPAEFSQLIGGSHRLARFADLSKGPSGVQIAKEGDFGFAITARFPQRATGAGATASVWFLMEVDSAPRVPLCSGYIASNYPATTASTEVLTVFQVTG